MEEFSVKDLTMILLSFAGFLRFDEVSSLLCSDVKIECEYLFLFIRKSKNPAKLNKIIVRSLTTNKSLLPKCILQSSKSISITNIVMGTRF
jgi:hypothetical protein